MKLKKSLGQHFILKASLHRKIAAAAGEITGQNIIEIGPGNGGLSKAIIAQKPLFFTMIEKDQDLARYLLPLQAENIKLIFDDALNIDVRNLFTGKAKIIANLPYNIATNLIMTWLEYASVFDSITVLIQKEVANRFLAKIGDKAYSRISILTELMSNVRKEFDVSPDNFTPPPAVDSTLITFTPLAQPKFDMGWSELNKITRIAFASPRKTIINNLKAVYPDAANFLAKAQIDPIKRPENVSLEEFYKLVQIIKTISLKE